MWKTVFIFKGCGANPAKKVLLGLDLVSWEQQELRKPHLVILAPCCCVVGSTGRGPLARQAGLRATLPWAQGHWCGEMVASLYLFLRQGVSLA